MLKLINKKKVQFNDILLPKKKLEGSKYPYHDVGRCVRGITIISFLTFLGSNFHQRPSRCS